MTDRILRVVPKVAVQAKQWNQHCMTEIYSKFAMTMVQKNNTSVWPQWISMKKARSREKNTKIVWERSPRENLFSCFDSVHFITILHIFEGASVRISSQKRSNTSVSVTKRTFKRKQLHYFWNCGKRSLMEQGKNDRPLFRRNCIFAGVFC